MADFILASASPRRLELLKQIGLVPLRVVAAEIDETPGKSELPEVYAVRVASEKARAVWEKEKKTVLAADTVVVCGRRILPKAEDEKAARDCLNKLSGRRHRVMTAVAVIKDGKLQSVIVTTLVKFKRMTPEEIDSYILSGEWRGKAGGYAIQGLAAKYIPWMSGSYSNVVGLPLYETARLLTAF